MHSLAAVCAVLGLTAAWKSHTLKVSGNNDPKQQLAGSTAVLQLLCWDVTWCVCVCMCE
jgi:hypothetical protein